MATASSDAAAEEVLGLLVDRTATVLDDIQDAENIPAANRVTVLPITVDTQSVLQQRSRLLGVAAAGIAGVLLTLLIAGLVDGLSMQRKRRGTSTRKEAGASDPVPGSVETVDSTSPGSTGQEPSTRLDRAGDDLVDEQQGPVVDEQQEPVATRTRHRLSPVRGEPAMTAKRSPSKHAALQHRGIIARRGVDAVTMLTVYLVLLLAIPSGVAISALGSLGRPSLVWGLVLLAWWTVSRLQGRAFEARPVSQPVRFAFVVLLVLVLISYAAAMLRGQPADQVSPAFTALIRLLSWAGVLLVAVDGIRTMNDLARMTRRIGIGAGLLAALGLLQFLTGQALVDFFGTIPGLTLSGGLGERAGVIRSSGTAIHPLEYATAINAALPLAIAAAISHGFRAHQTRGGLMWWLPVGLISISSLVAVSRSATIGFAVAIVSMIPAFPRHYRPAVIGIGAALAVVVFAAVPGLLSTTVGLFAGAADDPSTQSRTKGLERVPEFMSTSPLIGSGFGIFLPRYYIFDNQWVLIGIELGILGIMAFAGFFVAGIWSARQARHSASDVRLLGHALAASMVNVAVLFAFFDGLSFPIAGGMLFLLAGLCGSIRTVAFSDRLGEARSSPARAQQPHDR